MVVSFKAVIIFWLIIAIIYIPTTIFKWYLDYPLIDIPLHFLGGAWSALFFFFLFNSLFNSLFLSETISHSLERIKILILAVSFSSLMGVFWEFGEFLLNQYFSISLQQSIPDTMGDFLFDILGAFFLGLGLLFFYFPKRKNANRLSS